jgi:ABC-2 type transport system permease protein
MNTTFNKQRYFSLFIWIGIIISINYLAAFINFKIDFTADQRYTISIGTKSMLKDLDEAIFFKVYLEGDLSPEYNQLKNATRSMLDEFRKINSDKIQYEFIDPSQGDPNMVKELYQQLAEKGLQPSNDLEKENGGSKQKVVFPGAIVSYKGKEIPALLLKSKLGVSKREMVNSSIENLEYELASAIQQLKNTLQRKVAFLQGHQELTTTQLTFAARALGDRYTVDTVIINEQLNALSNYNCLIVAKPLAKISEKDKFIIDQFVMHGGRLLWMADQSFFEMDSLMSSSTNLALPFDANFDDLLFNYGARINQDLIMDLQAAPIPIVTGYTGNQPKQDLFPWYYYALVTNHNNHPIVNNLNVIKTEFASSIDTIESAPASKTILLSTSNSSASSMTPARVSLGIIEKEPNTKLFNKKKLPIAVLLEGKFNSLYKNRLPKSISAAPEINFKTDVDSGKIIVVSDGDIAASYVSKKGVPYPLGLDRFTNTQYGNENFLKNCVDYLCGDEDLMQLRSKEIKLRLLDKNKVNQSNVSMINMGIPIILVLIFACLYNIVRKLKYKK